jgi:hypothetical protein
MRLLIGIRRRPVQNVNDPQRHEVSLKNLPIVFPGVASFVIQLTYSQGQDKIDSPKVKGAQDPSSSLSLFGAFPELAALEFGHALNAPKRMWQESLDKQLRILQEDE